MSNVEATKDGLIEKSSGRRILSPLDLRIKKNLRKIKTNTREFAIKIDERLSKSQQLDKQFKSGIKQMKAMIKRCL